MKENNLDIKHEDSRGFSLLETSIALIIMMVVTLGTASLYVYATNYNTGSADRAAVWRTSRTWAVLSARLCTFGG